MATAQDVLNAIAQAEAGDIGTYATLCPVNMLDMPTVGDTMSGADLYIVYPNFLHYEEFGEGYDAPSAIGYGTWKLCGDMSARNPLSDPYAITSLWLRIA